MQPIFIEEMAKNDKSKPKKQKLGHKLKRRYKLVIMDESTFEEKVRFRVTRLGVIVVTGSIAVLLITLTVYLIAFTPLREYIPGYTDITLPKKIYDLQQKADSLEREFRRQDLFIQNLKKIIAGQDITEVPPEPVQVNYNYDTISISHSREDSILRAEYETMSKYNLHQSENYSAEPAMLGGVNFFPPLHGIVTRHFDAADGHYGTDIVAGGNEAIKATLDGTVIFSDWTLETGYIIGIQHKNNIISVYKHNSAILKHEGTFVKAGEIISFVGASGELTTGPHLHFELWFNGNPVDPEKFIEF